MRNGWYTGRAIGFGAALTLVGALSAQAQVRSDRVIPVRKEGTTQRESRGEVMVSADRARIDSLEMMALSYQRRIDSISAAASSLSSRADATDRTVAALRDSLRAVHSEISSVRSELASVTARTNALGDSLYRLNRSFSNFRNGSVFGHSGFYMGVGTGANFTQGTLDDIGYKQGLNVSVPIGWNKLGVPIGIRAELGVQTFDGRTVGAFSNPDPKLYTAVGMLALHLPMNQAKTTNFYLMGGGGAYMFRDVGSGSAISRKLDETSFSSASTRNITKLGVQGGAGVEIHLIGATSLFVQSSFTNVFGEENTASGLSTGKNLRWVPVILGFQFR